MTRKFFEASITEAKIAARLSTALRQVWMVRAIRSIQITRPFEEDAKAKRPSASHPNRKVLFTLGFYGRSLTLPGG